MATLKIAMSYFDEELDSGEKPESDDEWGSFFRQAIGGTLYLAAVMSFGGAMKHDAETPITQEQFVALQALQARANGGCGQVQRVWHARSLSGIEQEGDNKYEDAVEFCRCGLKRCLVMSDDLSIQSANRQIDLCHRVAYRAESALNPHVISLSTPRRLCPVNK